MTEVKRAGQQMQKVANGSAYLAKTSSPESQRPKPYDRPSNTRLSGFKRRPFLGHGRTSAGTIVEKEVENTICPCGNH